VKREINMNIKVYSNTKIYVVCPVNTTADGQELLHQIAYHIKIQKSNIVMTLKIEKILGKL
jgi:hypothetical protein